MKPEGAIAARVDCDLSQIAFEDAAAALGMHPICTLVVHPSQAEYVKRVARLFYPGMDELAASPYINLRLDSSYNIYEWSLEYEGKIYWSPGA